MKKQLTILIVDDEASNRMIAGEYLKRAGHQIVEAANGKQAIQRYAESQPDLVLMDVVMPEMNGYEATDVLRKSSTERWVPIIFMSSLADAAEQVKGLEAGGDDYLVKPINFKILESKIQAMQRIAGIQKELADSSHSLQLMNELMAREQEMAFELMERMIQVRSADESGIEYWHQPAAMFSGDLIAVRRDRDGKLYVMQADSTGHGLAAALPILPISNLFYELAEQSHSVSGIVRQMNYRIRQQIPADRFVAATVLSIDPYNQVIELWNGASPCAVFVSEQGEIIARFESHHLPLGVAESEEFNARTEIYQWTQPGSLVLFSDGLTEARNRDGELLTEERIIEVLRRQKPEDYLSQTRELVLRHLNGLDNHDDISMIVVRCRLCREDPWAIAI